MVGLSGGIDSAVASTQWWHRLSGIGALCAGLGPNRAVGLLLQEKESSPENARLVRQLGRDLEITPIAEEITAALEGLGCYRRRDEAIRSVFPEYDSTYRAKITRPGDLLNRDALNTTTRSSPRRAEMRMPAPTAPARQDSIRRPALEHSPTGLPLCAMVSDITRPLAARP